MAQYGKFTLKDAQKIAQTVRDVRGQARSMLKVPERSNSARTGGGLRIRDAELTANLSAASNSKTGAATAAAKFLVPDPDNAGDLMDGDAFTVTNRSLDATGLSGDYIVVAKIAGEWRPIWIDC